MKLLRVWCGPMCAAKTTGALQVARRYARQGMQVLLVRPGRSKRDHEDSPGLLKTKAGEAFPSVDVRFAVELTEICREQDVVWIDEPSIFEDEEQLPAAVAVMRKRSIILVSGLGATSELEPFGKGMPQLLATADEIHWAMADCDVCGGHANASRTLYVGDGPKSGQVQVGGAETYVPACSECWSRLMSFPADQRRALLAIP